MLRKGEVVSLGIFLVIGFLVGSLLISGPYEKRDTAKGEFEGGGGSVMADIIMGYYDEDGNPVHEETLGRSFVKPGTTQSVSYFKAQVESVTVEGEYVQPKTIKLTITLWLDYYSTQYYAPVSYKTDTVYKGADDFNIPDQPPAKWSYTSKEPPLVHGSFLQYALEATGEKCVGFNYKKDNCEWTSKVVIKCDATDNFGNPKSASCVKKLSIKTDWVSATPQLSVSAVVYPISLLPHTSVGLSIMFVVIVLFVGLWYKWGRKLLRWG